MRAAVGDVTRGCSKRTEEIEMEVAADTIMTKSFGQWPPGVLSLRASIGMSPDGLWLLDQSPRDKQTLQSVISVRPER